MSHRPSIDFLGHSSLAIELDGVRLLTDPAFRARIGPLQRIAPLPDRRQLDGADAVLVSHLHWDHLDLPSLRALGRDVRVVVPVGAGAWLRGRGFRNAVELPLGRELSLGGLTIEAVPARHSGARPPLGPDATAVGYVVRGSRSVYFAGDTALHAGMARLDAIDVALLPVWGWGPTLPRERHLDPEDAARALRLIRPRVAVPIHWGTYWPGGLRRVTNGRLVDPPREFVAAAAELAPDVCVVPASVGERILLP